MANWHQFASVAQLVLNTLMDSPSPQIQHAPRQSACVSLREVKESIELRSVARHARGAVMSISCGKCTSRYCFPDMVPPPQTDISRTGRETSEHTEAARIPCQSAATPQRTELLLCTNSIRRNAVANAISIFRFT